MLGISHLSEQKISKKMAGKKKQMAEGRFGKHQITLTEQKSSVSRMTFMQLPGLRSTQQLLEESEVHLFF